jgi:hypothetical protein
VDRADHVRAGQHQEVVIALEIPVMGGKARAAIVGLAQLVLLDLGAHAAIQDQDALGKKRFQFGAAVGLHIISPDNETPHRHGSAASEKSGELFGRSLTPIRAWHGEGERR